MMLDYGAFAERLLVLLDRDPNVAVDPDAVLYDEVGLDSLQAFHMIVIIETLADTTAADELPDIYTMRDAFAYYKSLCLSGG